MAYRVLCITDKSDLPETELFTGLHRSGVLLDIACNPNGRHFHRLREASVNTFPLILKGRYDRKGIAAIRQILKAQPYDIIYCFNNRAITNAVFASRGYPASLITYRGVAGNVSFWYPTSWFSHLNPRVKKIVCVSNSIRQYFLSLSALGKKLDPATPVTIYKGHNLAWYNDKPADLSTFGIPDNAFVVAFAGRNRPNKGLRYIVESSHFLPPEINVHYLLMGKLEHDKSLRKLINQTPCPDNFHFTGFRNDVPSLVAACNAFIMPSVFKEGFSRAVIEAMAYGITPVVSNIGGNTELIEHNKSGLVVPPKDARAIADALLTLQKNPSLNQALGQAARERLASEFTNERTVRETRELFERLASQSSGQRAC